MMAESTRPWESLMGPVGRGGSATVLAVAITAGLAIGHRTRRHQGLGWALVMGVVGFDLVGGMVAFQLRPTRAQYAHHTPRARLGFVTGHLHPFLLPLSGQGSWARAMARYATAVATTVVLERCPGDSRPRRGAVMASAIALAAGDVLTDRSPQRWLGPVYLIKLVGGHGSISRTDLQPH